MSAIKKNIVAKIISHEMISPGYFRMRIQSDQCQVARACIISGSEMPGSTEFAVSRGNKGYSGSERVGTVIVGHLAAVP